MMQKPKNDTTSPFNNEERLLNIGFNPLKNPSATDQSPKRKRYIDDDNNTFTDALSKHKSLHPCSNNNETPKNVLLPNVKMDYSIDDSAHADDHDDALSMDPALGAKVLEYQKKAIWYRMLHYKRLYLRECETISDLKHKENAYLSTASLFVTYLEKTRVLLEELFKSHPSFASYLESIKSQNVTDVSRIMEIFQDLDLPCHLLDNALRERFLMLEKFNNAIICAIKDTNKLPDLKNSHGKVNTQTLNPTTNLEKFDEMNILRVSIKRFQSKVASLQDELERTNNLLEYTQKKLDKADLNTSLRETPINVKSNNNDLETSFNEGSLKAIISALDAEKSLSKSRLSEIERLQSDKHRLLSEITNIKAKDKEKNTSRTASPDIKYILKENSILKSKLEDTEHKLEQLKMERRNFSERLKGEELERRVVLESQIKKSNQNLQRVRANRDYLQHNLNLRISNNENELARSQKLSALAKASEDRIASLMEEMRTYKLIITGSKGNNTLYELFNMHLDQNLAKKLEAQISDYDITVNKLNVDLQILEKKLALWKENKNHTDNEQIDELANKLVVTEQSLEEMKVKYELSEKTQSKLLSEIENLGEAWCELEKQTRESVSESLASRDALLKCTAEKSKLEQKNVLLAKQIVIQTGQIKALKAKSVKQAEQLELVSRQEKILVSQLINIEKELSITNSLSQKHQRSIEELIFQLDQLKASEKKWISRHSVVFSQFKEKQALYDEARERCKKLNIEKKHLQSELDALNKVVVNESSGNTSALKKELEEYKFLLKCSSCNTRFKSHVLLKCMHTFCKECIEETWNSRQRKCPSCGVNFSKQEAKQIYL